MQISPCNNSISYQELQDKWIPVEEKIGYTFKNRDLLKQAFTRRSYAVENGCDDNEALEFIGDKVLDIVVVRILTEHFGAWRYDLTELSPYGKEFSSLPNTYSCQVDEDVLTKIKERLVETSYLAARIDRLELASLLIMSKGDEKEGVGERESVKADLFEAIVGAVAIDSGWNFEDLYTVVESMLSPRKLIDWAGDNCLYFGAMSKVRASAKIMPVRAVPFCKNTVFVDNENMMKERERDVKDFVYIHGKEPNYEALIHLYELHVAFVGYGLSKVRALEDAYIKASRFIDANNVKLERINPELVGEITLENAINKLQELAHKRLARPQYSFREGHDENGNPVWRCECRSYNTVRFGYYSSKREGKKHVALEVLEELIKKDAERYET